MRRLPPARLLPARLLLARLLLSAPGMVLWGGATAAVANEGLRYDLRAELGSEYDSNAHRTETVSHAADRPVVASALGRAAIAAHLSDIVAPGQQVAVSATLAGKLFTTRGARSENVGIAQSSGLWRLMLGPRTAFNAQALYYEAFQPTDGDPATADERRDFRSLTPLLQLERRLWQDATLVAGAGYRWFVFKSDLSFDFRAPVGTLDLRWAHEGSDGGADWELTAGSSLERRAFEGRAAAKSGIAPSTPMPLRRDSFLVNHVELTRVGAVLIGVGYGLHWNQSNSYGETLTRHLATVRFATPLPFELYLAARAELIIASYRDAVAVGRDPANGQLLSIDDENRSSLRIDVSRALSERLQLLARYTLYVNELGVSSPPAAYQRQTAMLSLAFTLDN